MVHEGKWAEVMHCRQGETVSPVAGRTKEPVFGKIRDGEENVRTVSQADVIKAELSCKERPARVQRLSVGEACARRVKNAHTVAGREKSIQPKAVGCRAADQNMTLETLFHTS